MCWTSPKLKFALGQSLVQDSFGVVEITSKSNQVQNVLLYFQGIFLKRIRETYNSSNDLTISKKILVPSFFYIVLLSQARCRLLGYDPTNL